MGRGGRKGKKGKTVFGQRRWKRASQTSKSGEGNGGPGLVKIMKKKRFQVAKGTNKEGNEWTRYSDGSYYYKNKDGGGATISSFFRTGKGHSFFKETQHGARTRSPFQNGKEKTRRRYYRNSNTAGEKLCLYEPKTTTTTTTAAKTSKEERGGKSCKEEVVVEEEEEEDPLDDGEDLFWENVAKQVN